ncbi:MAG: sigma-70 family RNA polymerase sigma factor [Verrucomicrobiae bacterium]|nr:sigma-70 family RNA polymerase sigma factor [Verrucomicrobiae bacterium]
MHSTRESLLGRLKDPADHDGWQRFFDTYGGVISAFARKAGLPPSEVEEVLQETLVSVAGEMPGFRYDRSRGGFKAWLFQIARRRIADQFRKRARHQGRQTDYAEGLEALPDPAADPLVAVWEQEWRHNQLQLAGERVKAKVAPRQWQMFDLATLQGWPVERITSLLGINRAQVYMAKMRVGRLLKAELQQLDSG